MKAPDKIYLAWEYSEIDTLPPGVTTKQVFGKDVAYIRKDALLEWLENEIKLPDVSFINGLTYLAYKDVIDKLNSL